MLKHQITKAKRTVSTDSVQITIGEIANMYKSDELNVNPDFQRLFRWPDSKKSNFVESIFIGIPIPPVFVFEKADGTWELIDGLQRISTILEFMGLLTDPDTDERKRSVLSSTKYLPALEDTVWEAEHEGEVPLDKPHQLFFRRHRIDFQMLKHPSDPSAKYDLFQRLNRGGTYANEQEVRTCAMVFANQNFTQQLRDFVSQEYFQKSFRVTRDQRRNQKDLEYAVRLLAHSYQDLPAKKDVQEFLDDAILDVITNRDVGAAMEEISWTISSLYRIFGDNALMPVLDAAENRFSLRALEGVAVGITRNRQAIMQLDDADGFIRERVEGFWQQPEVDNMSSTGLRGTTRIQRTVPFGAEWFDPNG